MKSIYISENKIPIIREGLYDDYCKDDADVIYYNFDKDDDGEKIFYVLIYDMDGSIIYEEDGLYEHDLYEILNSDTANLIIYDNGGVYNENTNLYCVRGCNSYTIEDVTNVDEVNNIAKKIFKNSISDTYHSGLHGYILTDGTCIDLGYDDHNSICKLPKISDKWEFIALGNIRCGDNFFDLIKKPTKEQRIQLRKLIANSKDLSVDIFNGNSAIPSTSAIYYGNPNPNSVLGEIDRFFSDGLKLEGGYNLYENYNIEYDSENVDISSFEKQDTLNKKFWVENDLLDSKIRLQLLNIADDFFSSLEVSWVKPKDIIMTGSLCNYNWSTYSDIDLHIVIDFSEISDKKDLVQEYFDAKKNEWNNSHTNLTIHNFNVELYVEDIVNDSVRGGIYSLEQNKWIKKPSYDDLDELSNKTEEKIKRLAAIILTRIEDFENDFEKPQNDYSLRKLQHDVDLLFSKLKKIRINGLKKRGEMSIGNIIYKICRRTNYLQKLIDLKNNIYDKLNSL